MTADEAEAEALKYVLGLDGLGLGGKAAGIYGRALARDIRPLLLRQATLLRPTLAGLETDDAAVVALEAEVCAAWGRCLEQLKTLWLTEGQTTETACA